MSEHQTSHDADRPPRLLRIVVRTVAIAVFTAFVVLTVVLLAALGS